MHDAGVFIPTYAGQGGGYGIFAPHAKCAGELLVHDGQHERAVAVLVYDTVRREINQKRCIDSGLGKNQ